METEASAAAHVAAATPAQGLTLRRVAIDTWRENVAYLHRDCAVVRAEGFQALSKVEVRANGKRILATLNVVDDVAIVGCGELGVAEDAFAQLSVPDGHPASVAQAEPPESIPALFRKINGERLGQLAREQGLPALAIPRDIRLVTALPLLGTGKTDYVSLKAMAAQSA